MMQKAAPILIWLLVIILGISLGAGLYEGQIVVPIWAKTPPETWINTGIHFWAFVSTGPLSLVIILSLLAIWRYRGPSRVWWMAALGIALVERVATFAYFIPTMIDLQRQVGLDAQVRSTLETWSTLNHFRHVLTFSAWLLALKALSVLNKATPR